MQDLVTIDDPDWASFQAADPAYLLRVTGEVIRKYCGWHIYPNLKLTQSNLRIRTRGMIMLPSLYVTAVDAVVLQSPNEQSNVPLDPEQYNWFTNGSIEPMGMAWYGAYSGYYYGPDNWSYLPVFQFGLATVTYDSGYLECPDPVKQVAYELALVSGEMRAGNVKEVASPGFRLQLSQDSGMNLNPEQKSRLASYRIGAVA